MPQKVELVCIIDDDRVYVNLVSKVIELRKLSKEIMIFKNGKEAIDFFRQHADQEIDGQQVPKIILLDLNMPIMDGWEFLEEYTEIKTRIATDIELFVVSSSINPRDINRAKAIEEVSDYIVKPIRSGDFERIFTN